MWKPEHRRAAGRGGLRYPSDLTDAEWALVAPMIPPAKRGGRKRSIDVREVLNGIFYVLSTGCQWNAVPTDLPPRARSTTISTSGTGTGHWSAFISPLCCRARARRARGKSHGSHHRCSKRQGRAKRGASLDPSGYDAGKKIKGRKRHILVDTLGLLLNVVVHPADIQDRDGARLVLDRRTRRLYPFIERVFADAGYQATKTAAAVAKAGAWKLEIVKRIELHRFVVLPKRWIVERTLAWISRCRRLAKDFERHARKAAAFIRLAMIRLMLRRLTTR